MTRLMIAVVVGLAAVRAVAQQPGACQVSLATVTLPQRSYVEVGASPFGDRVFLYAPDIQTGMGRTYRPFQLWVVEGIYGRPFVQRSGSLDEAAFAKIRQSSNVRSTPIAVDASKRASQGRFVVSGKPFFVEVIGVKTQFFGADTVTARVCR